MFAIVESGSITSFPKGNRGIQIGSVKHSADIFTPKWTESERNAIGLYTVEIDETNRKDTTYYTNTDISYAYDASSNKVKGTYGTSTAKSLTDVTEVWTQSEIDAGQAPDGTSANDNKKDSEGNNIITLGLKTLYKNRFNVQAAGLLAKTDWYVVKATEVGSYSVPSNITNYRAAVRTKVNQMETSIDGCANIAALITLLSYTTTDGVTSRPLGEFPDEVV